MAIHNGVRVYTATIGTGSLLLGIRVPGFLSFLDAGVADGETVPYCIADGLAQEGGHGVYSAATSALTRTVSYSTAAGAPLNLSGRAEVSITVLAEDIVTPAALGAGTLPASFTRVIEAHQVLTPLSGFSVTLAARRTVLIPATPLAAGTITMAAAAQDGQVLTVTSTQDVAALTMLPATGQTILSPPTFLTAGWPVSMLFHAAANQWLPTN